MQFFAKGIAPAPSAATDFGTFSTPAYHSSMRHLMLVLMIVLLPLRGWVGDAMATDMAMGMATGMATSTEKPFAQHPSTAIKKIADHAHAAGADGHLHHELAMHEATPVTHDCTDHAATHTADTGDHCSGCGDCQTCHSVALSPPAADLNPRFSTASVAPAGTALFTSAATARGQKPPIS